MTENVRHPIEQFNFFSWFVSIMLYMFWRVVHDPVNRLPQLLAHVLTGTDGQDRGTKQLIWGYMIFLLVPEQHSINHYWQLDEHTHPSLNP